MGGPGGKAGAGGQLLGGGLGGGKVPARKGSGQRLGWWGEHYLVFRVEGRELAET